MMTKNMKPVWRINTGDGVPSDFGGIILYFDGSIIEGDNDYATEGCYWLIDSNDTFLDDSDIYAYQTTRTREAKR